jgi:hypothetical protein
MRATKPLSSSAATLRTRDNIILACATLFGEAASSSARWTRQAAVGGSAT